MNQAIHNNPAVLEKILLAVFAVALSLAGSVQAQTGIDTGLTSTGTSSGQQAVARVLNAPIPVSACSLAGAVFAIAQVTAPGSVPAGCSPSPIPTPPQGAGVFGGTSLQQLSNQSSIQVNTTVLASPAETARTVRCLSAQRNGVEEPGCQDVLGAAAPTSFPATAWSSLPAATRAYLAAAGSTSASPATAIAGPLGLSVVVRGSKGTQDTVSGQTGFDASAGMLTAGLDYRFSDKWVGGVSFSYQHSKLDFDFNSGTLSNDAYRLAPFFSYAVTPDVLVDGLIGVGYLDYDSDRICSACVDPLTQDPLTLVNTASYSGTQYFASIGIGKSWPLGAWALRGYVRGDYVQVNIDDYTETGTVISGTINTTTALQVQSQSANSLTSLLGIRASRAISTKTGVVTPSARIEWVHQFTDDSRTLSSQFVSVAPPNNSMAFTTAEPERDWVNLGITLQMNFARSLAGFVDYMYTYRSDASNNALSLGVRYNF